MLFVPLGGFLGAGKTTTMVAAARRLEAAGERVSVITNDQGTDLVDTELVRAALPADAHGEADAAGRVAEVTGGCFCCRFDDLAAVVERLRNEVRPSVVLAEAVGSCTDLQSTVVRPLRAFYADDLRVAPLTVLVDPGRWSDLSRDFEAADEPDLTYLYRHQLDEADLVAVNKADLLGAAEAVRVRDAVANRFPHAAVVTVSAATGQGLDDLVARWTDPSAPSESAHVPFAVDYDRYGAAEAELAWTNQTLEVTAAGGTFVPYAWVERFLAEIGDVTGADRVTVGHVKVRLRTASGTTKASLTTGGSAPSWDEREDTGAAAGDVVVNARVRMAPDDLDDLVARAVAAADTDAGTSAGDRTGEVFRPGFPVPVHRM